VQFIQNANKLKTAIKILHLKDIPADAEIVERQLKKGNFQFEQLEYFS